jgi:glycosyltransferase 2 family protein
MTTENTEMPSPPEDEVPLRPKRASVVFAVQVLIGLCMLVVLFAMVDLSQAWQLIRSANKWWIAVTILWVLSIFYTRAVMMCWLVRKQANVSTLRMFALNLVASFHSNFLPSQIGGDLVKGMYLFPRFSTGADAYASLILMRALGFVGTLTIAFLAAVLALPGTPRYACLGMLAGLVLTAMLLYSMRGGLSRWMSRKDKEPLPANRPLRYLAKLRRALWAYRHRKAELPLALLFAIAISAQSVILYYPISLALNTRMGFWDVVLAASLTFLSGILPLTPGNIGLGEGAFVVTGILLGAVREDAWAICILARAIQVLVTLSGGVLQLFMPIPYREIADRLNPKS